jgi:hypothetical protein
VRGFQGAQEPFEGRIRANTLSRLSKSQRLQEIMLTEMQMRPKKLGSHEGKMTKPLNTYTLFLVGRNQNIRRRSDNNHRIYFWKNSGSSDPEGCMEKMRCLRVKALLEE